MDTCFDCKRPTETVIDKSTGDTICTECSLVISDHYIDDCQEWRTFANDDNSDRDPNRVGAPTNPFLKSGGIGTIIDKSRENTSSVSRNDLFELCRAQNLDSNSEDKLIDKACKEIKSIAERLEGLTSGVVFRACEIVSKFDGDNSKRLRREKHLRALCAASVSTACRELKLSRTLKEISFAAGGVDLKHINKASRTIRRLLGSHQAEAASSAAPQVIINTVELVNRFCSKLCINVREINAIREAVEKAANFDIRRNPKSVLAAIIFMICQLSQTKWTIQDIAKAAEVVDNTVKNSAKDIYPYASKIIPSWYASEEDIIKRLGGIIGSWDAAKLTV